MKDSLRKKIIHNRIKCLNCHEIIESKYRYNYVVCKCGRTIVDGGQDYLRRLGDPNLYEELTEFEE